MQIKWLNFESKDEYVFHYSTNFEGIFNKVDLRRGSARTREKIIEVDLKQMYLETLPLAELKVKNLQGLLPFISHYNKPYYENIRVSSLLNPDDLPVPEDYELDETDLD